MPKLLNELRAQINGLAKAEAEKKVAKLMSRVGRLSKALSRVTREIASFQKAVGGKGRVGRRLGRKPAAKRSRKGGVSRTLKAIRKKIGVNQQGLAKILKVSIASVRAWEQGRSQPREDMMSRIAALQKKGGRKVRAKVGKPRKEKQKKVTPEIPAATPATEV